ncbi:hypothetical protein BC936DRAFT_144255 [Jimgerdemannia flammicorona]|uniref:Uncharacterized protein n=1 Tax=Jimgerdemannia flammicorona TaxID=994334 RepID=A0A433DCV1_9FUNG|nr:hypothetical protein BC936DRAFT_144255 [Jimgerdemannia flammicorona]
MFFPTIQIADLHVDEAEAREDKDDNGEEAMNEEVGVFDEYEMSVKAIAEEIMNPPKFGEEEELKRQSRLERDTVAAILEDCGVSYTHVNENIIGSSEIEERIGKKALKAVESDVRMHMPAFRNDLSEGENGEDSEETVDDAEADDWRNNTEDEDEEDDEFSIGKRKRKRKLAAGAKSGQAGKRKLPLIGNTPVHVRQHQLAEMAQYLGFESTKKFADRVLEVGRREQKAFLNKYYKFKGVI